MEYVKIAAPKGLEDVFPDGVEIRKDIYDRGDQEEINRVIIGVGSQVIPMTEFDRRVQFARGATETAKGIGQSLGLVEEDVSDEMRARMQREGDAWSQAAYLGGAVAEFIPAAGLKVLTAPFKAVNNPVLRTALEFGAVGSAIGFAQPVYEELGDSRIFNTLVSGGVAAPLGGLVGKLVSKYGVKTEAEFKELYDRMTPEEQTQARLEADKLMLEDPEAQSLRRQAEAASAREAELTEEAKIAAANKTEAEAQKIEAERVAAEEAQFKAEADEASRKGFEADKEIYDTQVARIETNVRQSRLEELSSKMRSIIDRPVPRLKREIVAAKRKATATQNKIDTVMSGKAAKVGGKNLSELREELADARGTIEMNEQLLARSTEREAAVKEFVQLKKYGKSDVADQRIAEEVGKLSQPTMRTPAQPMRQESMPLEITRETPEAIGAANRPLNTTPPNAAGRVDSLGGVRQRAVPQDAAAGGSGNVPPTGGPTPQGAGAATPPPSQTPPPQSDYKQGSVSEGADKLFGALSTRIRNISESVFGRLRRYEYGVERRIAQSLQQTEQFMRMVNKLPKSIKDDVALKLFNGEHAEAMKLMSPELRAEFVKVQRNLRETYRNLKEAGVDFPVNPNYFPRKVKDYDGLLEAMGREKQGVFTEALMKYSSKNDIDITDIPADVRSDILDQVVRGVFRSGDTAPMPNAKQRTVSTIKPEYLKFYEEPSSALGSYIRNSAETIEKAKFFGRALNRTSSDGVNVDASIGSFLDGVIHNEGLNAQQQAQLLQMLRARFIGGEQNPAGLTSFARDTAYAGTIANYISALTQLSDLGSSGALHGLRETIAALVGTKNYKIADMGIDHTIANELQNERLTAKALNKLFALSGFKAIDRLGKETLMNAAINKNAKLVKTPKGEAAFRKKWGGIFEDDIDVLVNDLQKGNMTENTRLLAFHELSDVQPISKSEMSQAYLDNPNGRILYMLKSFTLKQIDLVRRNVVQEAKKGNVGQAVKNATLLAGYLAAAGVGVQTVKDIILGRDIDVDALPNKAMWTVLGVYGANEYIYDRYIARGDVKGAGLALVTPAMPLLDTAAKVYNQAEKIVKGEDAEWAKATRNIPLVGPIVYSWYGGGKENYNDRLESAKYEREYERRAELARERANAN